MDADDEALIARIARGEEDALAEAYDRYGRVLFGVCYRMLGDPEASEEVTQDVFAAVWRRAGTFDARRGTFRGWLLQIARNSAIDWRRTRGKRVERETTLDEALSVLAADTVDEQVAERLRAGGLREALGVLPADQRTAITLAYWGGLSQTEIAARTGAPLGTVKSRIRLALDKLRVRLVMQ